MIASESFVFLHLHKSGGTFINEMIVKNFPAAVLVGYHLPYAYLPEIYRGLPVFGTVRNPWAYYVSWYHYQRGQAQPNALFLICSDSGRLGFAETIRNLVMLADDDVRIEALMRAFPERFPNRGINLTRRCISTIRGTKLGFYSFLYTRHYQGAAKLTLLNAENLRIQLRAYLERLKIDHPSAMQFIAESPPLNVTHHAPYQRYYDPVLAALVRERDALVIKNHDYSL